jgi:hypothetical protein
MSKLTAGLVAGAVLTCAATLSVLAVNGNAAHDTNLNAGATGAPASSASIDSSAVAGKKAAQLVSATTNVKAATMKQAVAVKPVRSVTLALPTTATDVGSNVTGWILVVDTAGKSVTPVEGAAVALQQKRGKVYVTLSDGLTDSNGQFPVAFTSKVNTTWRAELTPATGAKKDSKTVVTTASASVNWAARPNMDVVHGKATSYAFRVNTQASVTAATAVVVPVMAHLEIANIKTPTKWIAVKNVVVPYSGVVAQSAQFPTAGTWLLRGASAPNANNAAGYTTALTIDVS